MRRLCACLRIRNQYIDGDHSRRPDNFLGIGWQEIVGPASAQATVCLVRGTLEDREAMDTQKG